MTLTEIHMIAEIFGSVFLVISAVIIIFELHQNLKQRKIQNTFARLIEVEKVYYKLMEKDFSILINKGRKSFSNLEDYEKNQFSSYISLMVSMLNRADQMAADTSYAVGKKALESRIKAHVKFLFSHPGMLEGYEVLRARGTLVGSENIQKVMDELFGVPKK